MKAQSQVAELFHSAAEAVTPLVELASDPNPVRPADAEPLFRNLRDRLACLPVAKLTYALLNALVSDAEELIGRSEFGAARWQLFQAHRRLVRYQAEWEKEGTPSRRRSLQETQVRESVEASQ